MDEAVKTWLAAGALYGEEHNPDKPRQERRQIKQKRQEMYRQADKLAGNHAKLMNELTVRGHIVWAF